MTYSILGYIADTIELLVNDLTGTKRKRFSRRSDRRPQRQIVIVKIVK